MNSSESGYQCSSEREQEYQQIPQIEQIPDQAEIKRLPEKFIKIGFGFEPVSVNRFLDRLPIPGRGIIHHIGEDKQKENANQ
jgi:hypothetical protein